MLTKTIKVLKLIRPMQKPFDRNLTNEEKSLNHQSTPYWHRERECLDQLLKGIFTQIPRTNQVIPQADFVARALLLYFRDNPNK